MPKSQPGPTSLSVQLIRQILESALDPTLAIVMIALAWHASERNGLMVWPSIERLAWLTKLSRATVKRSLKILADQGIVFRVQTGCGRGARIGFDLVPERLPARPAWSPGSVFRDGKRAHPEPLPLDVTDGVTSDGKGVHCDPEGVQRDPERGSFSAGKGAHPEPLKDVLEEDQGRYVREEEQPALRAGAPAPDKPPDGRSAEAVVQVVRSLTAMALPPMKRARR